MRHQFAKRSSFGLKKGPRQALVRGLISSLVEHERIKTTRMRAWSVRRLVEKAITLGKKQNLSARRVLLSKYPNQKTVAKIMDDLSKRFQERAGGFTRMIKLGSRPGDQTEMVYLEFVDYDPSIKAKKKETETKAKSKKKKDSKKEDKKSALLKDDSSLVKKQIFLKKKKKKKHLRKVKSLSRKINRPS